MKTFRFDDICINTDEERLKDLILVISGFNPGARILLAVSPIVFSREQLPPDQQQRVHPRQLTAMSSLDPYFRGEGCGVPALRKTLATNPQIDWAGHGIAHVDHRLLSRQTQELSIVMSCALVRARIFVPPYNKHNADTREICRDNGIELVEFEHGWKHISHNEYDARHERYYLHPYDATHEELTRWFKGQADEDRLAQFARSRAGFHLTFNGGWESEPEQKAFHHGMDTVFNGIDEAIRKTEKR